MFTKVLRTFRYLKLKSMNDAKNKEIIPKPISAVKQKLQQTFADCSDFILREIEMGEENQIKIIIAFIDGIVNKGTVNRHILEPIMIEARKTKIAKDFGNETINEILLHNLLSTCDLKQEDDFRQSVDAILSGNVAIFMDGNGSALLADVKGWEARGIVEPATEAVVRGPREGFNETLRTNTSLLRRRIKNPNFKIETIKLGSQTNTDVCICYIKGIADEKIVETVRRRLKKINTDAILESGYIEEFIEDAPFSIFPTVGNSEKPDSVAGKLLEGRVAILCDGTPFALTVPFLFVETIQTSEDYYARPWFSSLIRLMRILALFVSATLPAFYIALISFHHNVIPFKLLITIAASREGIPFSPFSEALLMGVIFEFLREAGVRLPRPVGQAISIVGALVLGEAAVNAGLASNPMVTVTALTAISSFIVPPLGGTLPILRLVFLISANILGFMGIMLCGMALFIHLCTLRSFGVPYMAPLAPLSGRDFKDVFVRVPVWAMLTRPRALHFSDNTGYDYRMKVNFRKKED